MMTDVKQEKDDIVLDSEMEFFVSQNETESDWVQFKENVRPLKRGRNVELLNKALRSHTQYKLKSSLQQTRRKLIEAIEEYQGLDPLQPWLECISWVQESFPSGGDSSGLILLYEQCVRSFWHSERYREDVRYLKVWLEYAENCKDAEVIFKFLESNNIGKSHAILYISYATHMESKNKTKTANEIFNLGISRKAQPTEKLQDAFKRFLTRSMKITSSTEEETGDTQMPSRCFGTVLSATENTMKSSDLCNVPNKRAPLAIYNDNKRGKICAENSLESQSWKSLGSVSERNKENNAIPSKWSDQRIHSSRGVGLERVAPCIQVFVDEECERSVVTRAVKCCNNTYIFCVYRISKANDDKGKKKLKLRRKEKRDMK